MLNMGKNSLAREIMIDLLRVNKLVIVLLVLIVFTAFKTIVLTHEVRGLTSSYGVLIAEKQSLRNEYYHLQLEQTTKSNRERVMAIAKKARMQFVNDTNEIIIQY